MKEMRASDRERYAAVRILHDGCADGRLSTSTFEQRIERALTTKSAEDLHGLTLDLKRVSRVRAWVAHLVHHNEQGLACPAEACLWLRGVGHRPFHIGRSDGADLVVHDETVSRVHAHIVRTPGGFMLTDLSSMNGTWADGRRVGQVEVRHGDLVWLGDMPLHLI
jgi:hypothetical protein